MSTLTVREVHALYSQFKTPIMALNCGEKCSPYNENGVPFCCDTQHAVPVAYDVEWDYLRENTDLWHLWHAEDREQQEDLEREVPPGMVPIACLGHSFCQRGYRSIACRSFPFFPYLTKGGEFIGISYYWEYEDRCWVISNLGQVSQEYLSEFIAAYDRLFQLVPGEVESYRYHSIRMRRVFGQRHRTIPLLHRNGNAYKISPRTGRLRKVSPSEFQRHGPYLIAEKIPFPGEAG
jgi:hypothetical protein